ncbi:MAG: hypothetical protein A3I61_05975 [Acidobacteria bacterium RIFCSPLOWO2_02_FULL_68_18]|nr:MAG: hypothetical protein A3I61_05975 [Acidobacteria bacterium RIFCSPLOWO2_02_FULL_68_18]OFW51963.1 MAG: hypothetical protein A3G77_04375 [Acidobacteria bacterium RIFCSPLOWO2_12_FULL_68_19]
MRMTGAVCSVVLAFVAARHASATVLLPADFQTVVAGSGTIVHGRVIDVRSALVGPRRAIETFVTVEVLDAWKGSPGSSVTFRVPNGQVGRYRRVLVGAPEFAGGDEVVVFLRGQAPAIPALFGLSQGVYRVSRGARARPVVAPPPVMARGDGAERVARGESARQPLPLEAFAREVEAVLERDR